MLTFNLMRIIIGIVLTIAFIAAVLGCGTGFLPSMTSIHGKCTECFSMLTHLFIISNNYVGGVQLLLLLLTPLFLIALRRLKPTQSSLFGRKVTHAVLKLYYGLAQLYNLFLRQFSDGILHPNIYKQPLSLN